MIDKTNEQVLSDPDTEARLIAVTGTDTTIMGNAISESYESLNIPQILKAPEKLVSNIESRKKHKQTIKRHVKRILQTASFVITFIFLTTVALCMTVSGVRNTFNDILLKCQGYSVTDLPGGGKIYHYQEPNAPIQCDGIDGLVTFPSTKKFSNQNGDIANLLIQSKDAYGAITDKNLLVDEIVQIGDHSGQYVERLDQDGNLEHILNWYGEKNAYLLTGEFTKEEMIEVAESIKD